MCMRHPIVPVCAPPDPFRIFYSGSDDTINPVSYIVCLHGQMPKRYELWRLNDCGVCEVHLFDWVRLLDNFREDIFKTFFFNLRRCRIPFIGWRLLNAGVEFIRFTPVTSDAEVVIYTPKNNFTIGLPILPLEGERFFLKYGSLLFFKKSKNSDFHPYRRRRRKHDPLDPA